MEFICISQDCGAAYIQGYPGLLFDDNLIAAGWEHTAKGWLCNDCTVPPADLCTCQCHVGDPPCARCFERQCPIVEGLEHTPETKEEWRVILGLLKMIRTALPAERAEMLRHWQRYLKAKEYYGDDNHGHKID